MKRQALIALAKEVLSDECAKLLTTEGTDEAFIGLLDIVLKIQYLKEIQKGKPPAR